MVTEQRYVTHDIGSTGQVVVVVASCVRRAGLRSVRILPVGVRVDDAGSVVARYGSVLPVLIEAKRLQRRTRRRVRVGE
jgi:hypothetical protein